MFCIYCRNKHRFFAGIVGGMVTWTYRATEAARIERDYCEFLIGMIDDTGSWLLAKKITDDGFTAHVVAVGQGMADYNRE